MLVFLTINSSADLNDTPIGTTLTPVPIKIEGVVCGSGNQQ